MPLINFSGIASGIDAESLISATTEATRTTRVQPLEDKVTETTETNDALSELKTKLLTLKSALQDITTSSGGALVKQVTSSSETFITASAASSATNGTYTVSVDSGAKAKNGVKALYDVGGDDWISLSSLARGGSTLTSAPNNEITVTVGGEATTIEVTNTMTIADLVSEFNANNTKGVMSAVNVGTSASPQYRLMVTAFNTGAVNGAVSISAGSDFNTFLTQTAGQASSDSTFDVSGVATGITREKNTVTDIIPGITFNLQSEPTTPTDVTLTVSDDISASASKVKKFVDAWNDIVAFVNENNLVSREESGDSVSNIFAALSKTRIDDNALTNIRGALSAARAEDGSAVRIFADIGITTERDGTLKFDEDTFESAVNNEADSVNQLLMTFADTMATTGGTIDQYTGFNRLIDTARQSNDELISNYNSRIAELEKQITKTEENMRARFARLESTVGRLQQQQSALTSALAGL